MQPMLRGDEGGLQRFLAGFMALSLLAGMSNGIAKVVLPLYAASLHASSTQVGLTSGLQFIGVLFLSMPIGALSERLGGRRLFLFGGLGGAVVYGLVFPLVGTPVQLVIGVFVFGLLNPFRMVTSQSEFLHMLPRLGMQRAGWQRAAHTSGMFFVGPTLGALLLSQWGFNGTFLTAAAGLLLTSAIGARVISGATASTGSAPQQRRVLDHMQNLLGIIAAHKELRQTMAIEFVGQIAMSYFTVFVVLIAIRQFGMEVNMAAGLVTLQGASYLLVLFLGGSLFLRLSDQLRYTLAFSLLLLSELLLMQARAPLHLWLAAALLGLGLGVQNLTSVSRFARLTQQLGIGRVSGLFSMAGPAGGLVGSVLGGLLAQWLGPLAGFACLATLYAVQLLQQLCRPRQADGAATFK